ncbi:hypothetical protein [Pontimicrobium sp. IMCC45349]|uniref:hypothetical protein n=1 Tax=Pontimicrobium sp. IMCC45349 TaxID=3391574 RepID=UPI0039A21680
MRIQNKTTIASILFVLISFVCTAQEMPPPPAPPPPPGLPVDGFLWVLLVLGVCYGVFKLIKLQKKEV